MKQEVRRGRKFVEYHDPETQDEFTFTQEISGADVSYQETDGSWHPADENWATDGVDGFVLKNDKLNHKVRLNGKGGRTWYPRRNVNTEYMTFGVPQYRNGNKWSNFRFSGWSVDGKTITLNTRQGVTILVHNRWNGIKIDWVLASSSAPSRMRYPVSLTGITYVDGIIYGSDGAELGRLTPTTATDVNGAELVCSGSFANGYVEFQADVSAAQFPVTIDPDFNAASGGGRLYSHQELTYADARNNYYAHAANAIWIGQRYDNPYYSVQRTAIQYDTSSIPDDATITQANISITTLSYGWNAGVDFIADVVKHTWTGNYYGDENFDAILSADFEAVLLDSADITGGTFTCVSDNLDTTRINKTGTTQYGFIGENDRNNIAPTGDEYLYFQSAKLTVTYTASGGFHPINMTANMQSLTGGMRG